MNVKQKALDFLDDHKEKLGDNWRLVKPDYKTKGYAIRKGYYTADDDLAYACPLTWIEHKITGREALNQDEIEDAGFTLGIDDEEVIGEILMAADGVTTGAVRDKLVSLCKLGD